MSSKTILKQPINQCLQADPYADDFFLSCGLTNFSKNGSMPVATYLQQLSDEQLEDIGLSKKQLAENFLSFLQRMEELSMQEMVIEKITIIGGQDKSGQQEPFDLTITKGQIITIMGPTGSGKSCLLANIECLAQADTQTKRKILIDDRIPTRQERFQIENKLIAQLFQNMNFVMDLPVYEFLRLHGESRMVAELETVIEEIFAAANELAGERFAKETPLTELSGGQSRALMIADTAFLSKSPIILIDEIENAGVDRKKALELLMKEQKIVLMSTHDPILALMGDQRIIIENGGIKKILKTTAAEKKI